MSKPFNDADIQTLIRQRNDQHEALERRIDALVTEADAQAATIREQAGTIERLTESLNKTGADLATTAAENIELAQQAERLTRERDESRANANGLLAERMALTDEAIRATARTVELVGHATKQRDASRAESVKLEERVREMEDVARTTLLRFGLRHKARCPVAPEMLGRPMGAVVRLCSCGVEAAEGAARRTLANGER